MKLYFSVVSVSPLCSREHRYRVCVYTLQGLIRNTGGDCRCVAVGLGQRQQFRFLSIVMQHAHTQLSKRGSAQIGEAFCIKETAIGNAGGGSGDTISFSNS